MTTLHIFHNDLRLTDNTALAAAQYPILPAFIFTPQQIENNSYFSSRSVQFMCESLLQIDKELREVGSRLHIFFGDTADIVARILAENEDIREVRSNRDYTPFAIERDKAVSKVCNLILSDDRCLNPPHVVTKKEGSPYKKFTPYYNNAVKFPIAKPVISAAKFTMCKLDCEMIDGIEYIKSFIVHDNSASDGAKLPSLEAFSCKAGIGPRSDYERDRNLLNYDTTHLSAYLHFGRISARQAYYALESEALRRQLYWRDFFIGIAFWFPHVITGKHRSFNLKYARVQWNSDATLLAAWCEGRTGVPIVDACMRQLNTIGWMHNRGRLIAAGVLTKIMGINWEEGERYFARHLLDYDIAVNNGNWQFVAGSGVDAQPYFRIFNPYIQSAKFDPDAEFIKRWCPELADVPAIRLHNWYKWHSSYPNLLAPIFNYEQMRDKTGDMYYKALK